MGQADRVLVVAALSFEVAGLERSLAGSGAQVARTGKGVARAAAVLAGLIRVHRPAHIFGVGLCGGLDATVRFGTLAIPKNLLPSAPDLPVLTCSAWPGVTPLGSLMTVDAVAATPAAKKRLSRETGARWVDMETYGWARAAHEEGIPFTGIRVVLDGSQDYLPVCSRPRSWPSALTLPHRALVSRRILHHALRGLLCER